MFLTDYSSSTMTPGDDTECWCLTMTEAAAGRQVLRIDVFSLFPGLVDSFCSESLLGKARSGGLLDLRCHNIRDRATDFIGPSMTRPLVVEPAW